MDKFTLAHLATVIYYTFLGLLLYYVATKAKDKKRITFAAIITLIFLWDNTMRVLLFSGLNTGEPLWVLLPFSMCGTTYILSMIALWFSSEKIFRITIFWSLGAIVALLFPSESGQNSIFSPEAMRFYLTHVMIILSQIYMYKELGFRITTYDNIRAVKYLYATGFIMIILNTLMGTNFFYVGRPGTTFFGGLFGPWPFYLIIFIVLSFILMTLFYNLLLRIQNKPLKVEKPINI